LRSSLPRESGKVSSSSGIPSRNLSLPSRVCSPLEPSSRTSLARLPPVRFFFPFGVLTMMGSHSPQGTRPLGSVPFSAFLTLSRSCSAHHLPALFHAGPAHGVSLQGRFPPAEQCVLSNVRTLLWLSPKTPHFRVLLPASVLVAGSKADGDSDPPGIDLPRGISLSAAVLKPSSPELGGQRAEAD
jgi:hypothetical protein